MKRDEVEVEASSRPVSKLLAKIGVNSWTIKKRSLVIQAPFAFHLFLLQLTIQKLFQRRLTDAISVAHLLGLEALIIDRRDHILF